MRKIYLPKVSQINVWIFKVYDIKDDISLFKGIYLYVGRAVLISTIPLGGKSYDSNYTSAWHQNSRSNCNHDK